MVRKGIDRPRRRKTDDCSTPILPAGSVHPNLQALESPPPDVADRLISRRHLVIDAGDVFITKIAARAGTPDRYRVARDEDGPVIGEYRDYDDAVRAGDALATNAAVRLYYREGPGVVPQLLKDCRSG